MRQGGVECCCDACSYRSPVTKYPSGASAVGCLPPSPAQPGHCRIAGHFGRGGTIIVTNWTTPVTVLAGQYLMGARDGSGVAATARIVSLRLGIVFRNGRSQRHKSPRRCESIPIATHGSGCGASLRFMQTSHPPNATTSARNPSQGGSAASHPFRASFSARGKTRWRPKTSSLAIFAVLATHYPILTRIAKAILR